MSFIITDDALRALAEKEFSAELWKIDAQPKTEREKIELATTIRYWFGSPAWMQVRREELSVLPEDEQRRLLEQGEADGR